MGNKSSSVNLIDEDIFKNYERDLNKDQEYNIPKHFVNPINDNIQNNSHNVVLDYVNDYIDAIAQKRKHEQEHFSSSYIGSGGIDVLRVTLDRINEYISNLIQERANQIQERVKLLKIKEREFNRAKNELESRKRLLNESQEEEKSLQKKLQFAHEGSIKYDLKEIKEIEIDLQRAHDSAQKWQKDIEQLKEKTQRFEEEIQHEREFIKRENDSLYQTEEEFTKLMFEEKEREDIFQKRGELLKLREYEINKKELNLQKLERLMVKVQEEEKTYHERLQSAYRGITGYDLEDIIKETEKNLQKTSEYLQRLKEEINLVTDEIEKLKEEIQSEKELMSIDSKLITQTRKEFEKFIHREHFGTNNDDDFNENKHHDLIRRLEQEREEREQQRLGRIREREYVRHEREAARPDPHEHFTPNDIEKNEYEYEYESIAPSIDTKDVKQKINELFQKEKKSTQQYYDYLNIENKKYEEEIKNLKKEFTPEKLEYYRNKIVDIINEHEKKQREIGQIRQKEHSQFQTEQSNLTKYLRID